MTKIRIKDFQTFHDLVQGYNTTRHIFRGVLNAKYKLLPKLGRPGMKFLDAIPNAEKEMFRLFKDFATPYLPSHNLSNWELLAVAQHHGLPTRLLDWTRNPLVAAYFAVEKDSDEVGGSDSAIYAFSANDELDVEKLPDPLKVVAEGVVFTSHITRRIIAQSGLFTIHPN